MKENTAKDQRLWSDLIGEVNQYGYNIKYYFELETIDNEDRCLIPVLMKYVGKFDNPGASETLMRYMAYRGFCEVTELLLHEFKRTD